MISSVLLLHFCMAIMTISRLQYCCFKFTAPSHLLFCCVSKVCKYLGGALIVFHNCETAKLLIFQNWVFDSRIELVELQMFNLNLSHFPWHYAFLCQTRKTLGLTQLVRWFDVSHSCFSKFYCKIFCCLTCVRKTLPCKEEIWWC